jgi:hypothetical protein
VIELKRRYRELSILEKKLQTEHKTASELQRKMQSEMPTQAVAGPSELVSFSVTKMLSEGHGVTKQGMLDHAYWIELIVQHRALAESHVAFMEAALRPGLPASLQSLAQTYNIATRLWHTGFHSLLERFRTLLPSWQVLIGMRDTGVSADSKAQISEALDLMTDFIYFAYAYYSNLLENELFKVFRSSWIENLGDIARYRMAVAKINYFVGISDGVKSEAQRRDSGSHLSLGQQRRKAADAEDSSGVPINEEAIGSDEEIEQSSAQMKQDRASIGVAAARDWDLEEKEVWRLTARGWYAKGLAEVPGTGRLHHHLGILSRDDDLRALYHFCKSLAASHPYPAARESILPLFERSVQSRRVGDEASLIDLFVHMHGILFTRIQIDDFEPTLERFMKRLRASSQPSDAVDASAWMMIATINISAILSYGSTTGCIARQEEKESIVADGEDEKSAREVAHGSDQDDDDDEGEEEEEEEADEGEDSNKARMMTDQGARDEVTALSSAKALKLTFGILEAVIATHLDQDKRDLPPNPYMTILLTFISQECKLEGMLPRFEAFVPWARLVALGNAVPRYAEPIDPRCEVPQKIRSNEVPLPEDWCVRGMAWVGRRVYERGFWKPIRGDQFHLRGGLAMFESEMDMLERFTKLKDLEDQGDATTGTDDAAYDDDEDNTPGPHAQTRNAGLATLTLNELRWRRIVQVLTVLIKTVPGLDFDIAPGNNVHARHGVLVIAPPLTNKITSWQADAARQEVEEAIGHLHLAALEGRDVTDTGETPSVEEGGSGLTLSALPGHDEALQETKASMRKSHDQLKQTRPVGRTGPVVATQKAGKHRENNEGSPIRMLPGYTTLVLDTNAFLAPADILAQLSEAGGWMVVVPLSVVTELDGLKRRRDDVGKRAEAALNHLESLMKTKAVRVQTSRGNYLSDLKVRQEDIHFAAVGSGAFWPATYGRDGETVSKAKAPAATDVADHSASKKAISGGGGDVEDEGQSVQGQARSVDDVILRCLQWQATTHWRNRLLLFCSDEAELARREAEIADVNNKPAVARATLITSDRNLRIKARFRQLHALGPQELVDGMALWTRTDELL